VIDRTKGCIYCGQDGPYKDEHVIPAGLGAGDDWLLKDLVCKVCNNGFSAFESRVQRRAEIGVNRRSLQRAGRDRGSKTRPPALEAVATLLSRPDGPCFETELGDDPLQAPRLLPSVSLVRGLLEGGGTFAYEIGEFLNELERLLQDDLVLMRARPTPREPYMRICLALRPDGYEVLDAMALAVPETDAIWIEPLQQDLTGEDPVVFMRAKGGVVVRVVNANDAAAASFLSRVREELPGLRHGLATSTKVEIIPQPVIHVRTLQPEEDEMARFVAKMGFNLVAHESAELCRHACFDGISEFIRSSAGQASRLAAPMDEPIVAFMNALAAKRHWVMLFARPSADGQSMGLVFLCRLYGGEVQGVTLAEDVPTELADVQLFVVADYNTQTIERYDQDALLELVAGR